MNRLSLRCIAVLCVFSLLISLGGVFAVWIYYYYPTPEDKSVELPFGLEEFDYSEPDMPAGEISLLQRLIDVLNQNYTTDKVSNSREYLLEETINREWNDGAAPYIGSMENDNYYRQHLEELFGDVLEANPEVKFILKNENLIGDYDSPTEIAFYSTSDPLDWDGNHFAYVGVYLTVLTEVVVDAENGITEYQLVCNSVHGYCREENYHPSCTEALPSFTTDSWIDAIYFWHHLEPDPWVRPLPEDVKYDYSVYHSGHYSYEGEPWPNYGSFVYTHGKNAREKLAQILYG